MRLFMLIGIFSLLPFCSYGATIQVPGDYSTIQTAIDNATGGDEILVDPGTYFENLDFSGKDITVKSSGGAEATIIDGNFTGSVVSFKNSEGPSAILDGFTITNGSGTDVASEGYGGGIYIHSASPTIKNNIITANSQDFGGVAYGGGIFCHDSVALISRNTINGNFSSFYGSGIYLDYSAATIHDNDIYENWAFYSGGGIYLFESDAIITDNYIGSNDVPKYNGGGICCMNSSPHIEGNWIYDNWAKFYGGAIRCSANSVPVIINNNIQENSALYGGGIYCFDSKGTVTIADNTIWANFGKMHGGGIYCWKSSPWIYNNYIYGNKGKYIGGGIYCYDAAPLITNNTLYANYVDDQAGGGVGGGIATYNGAHPIVTNCILAYNSALTEGDALWIGDDVYPSSLTISNSNVLGGMGDVVVCPDSTLNWGDGMIDADPRIIEPSKLDFHLTYNSACRDTGDNNAPGLPVEDFEGQARVAGGTADMGADEFQGSVYFIGTPIPGGYGEVKILADPGTAPLYLWVGSGIMDPPLYTQFGDWKLDFPLLVDVSMGSMTSPDGILIIPFIVPFTPTPPWYAPIQCLIGDVLTDLCLIEIEEE